MKNINALVIASHDGFSSLYTGVGIVNYFFIEAFGEIKSRITTSSEYDLICLAPFLSSSSKDFRLSRKKFTELKCKEYGGFFDFIPTFSDGKSGNSVWGNVKQWQSASLSVASYIASLKKKYNKIILLGHDTIFLDVSKYIVNQENIFFIWIPHSLGVNFIDSNGETTERIKFEREAIFRLNGHQNSYIGYVGKTLKKNLLKNYNVQNKKLIPFLNGIYKSSRRYSVNNNDIQTKLNEYKVPLHKKFFFIWGRCCYQKGYDLVFPSFNRYLEKDASAHLVALLPLETTDKSYLQLIKSEIKKIPANNLTIINEFDPYLPYCLLKSEYLDTIIFCSRFEASPLAPLEALIFCDTSVKLIYSNIPEYAEIFKNIPQAKCMESYTVQSLLNCLTSANAGNRKKISEYDFIDNYTRSLTITLDLVNQH